MFKLPLAGHFSTLVEITLQLFAVPLPFNAAAGSGTPDPEDAADGEHGSDDDDGAGHKKQVQQYEDALYHSIVSKLFVSNGDAVVEEAQREASSHRVRTARSFAEWRAKKAEEAKAAAEAAAAAAAAAEKEKAAKLARSRVARKQWTKAIRTHSYVSYRSQTPVRVRRPGDAAIVSGRPLWAYEVPKSATAEQEQAPSAGKRSRSVTRPRDD